MSLAEMIQEARSRDLQATPEQAGVTERLVLPAMPQIVEAGRRARQRCDHSFHSKCFRRPPGGFLLAAGETSSAMYPVGHCEAIRDRVFEDLSTDPLLQALRSSGVVFKKVFIILDGCCFQNAIQLGNLYYDVANDALDPGDAPVEWHPVSELCYENLESCDSIAAAAEKYYQCRVFPNLYFPLLAPLVPLLAVRDNGRLDLLAFQDVFFLKDLGDGMRRLRTWLKASGDIVRRRLPEPYENALRRHFGANDIKVFPFEFRPCSPAAVADQARQIALAAKKPRQEHLVLTLLKMAPRAASLMRSLQIRPAR